MLFIGLLVTWHFLFKLSPWNFNKHLSHKIKDLGHKDKDLKIGPLGLELGQARQDQGLTSLQAVICEVDILDFYECI